MPTILFVYTHILSCYLPCYITPHCIAMMPVHQGEACFPTDGLVRVGLSSALLPTVKVTIVIFKCVDIEQKGASCEIQ